MIFVEPGVGCDTGSQTGKPFWLTCTKFTGCKAGALAIRAAKKRTVNFNRQVNCWSDRNVHVRGWLKMERFQVGDSIIT